MVEKMELDPNSGTNFANYKELKATQGKIELI